MKVLILAAGKGNLDPAEGGYPLTLTEFDGVPLIERLISASKALEGAEVIVTLRGDETSQFHLDNIVRLIDPQVQIVRVENETRGAACTALLAISQIDNDEELLILNGNELIDADFASALENFRSRGLAAGTLTFPSVHPRYSYVRLDDEGLVIEAAEKRPISRHATVGFYWFKTGHSLVEAVKEMIRKDDNVAGAYFICPAFNELVLDGLPIGVAPISSAKFHPLKSERQIADYENAVGEGR
jgi:dTDP-glucose pyrophosphorylase